MFDLVPLPWGAEPRQPAWGRAIGLVCESCRAAAKGPMPSVEEVVAWLRSRDMELVRRGMGWALKVRPPCIDELVQIARDPSLGVHAAAALVFASEDAEARARLGGDVARLARGPDTLMQFAALSVLRRFGDEGRRLALEATRQGNLSVSTFSLLWVAAEAPLRVRLAEAALDARTVSPELARHILDLDDQLQDSNDRLLNSVADLADGHADPWVRWAVDARLAQVEAEAGRALIVHHAFYGADGKMVDVTDALRSAVEDGVLRTSASNHLGGDPHQGVVKDLVVEYEVGGRRLVRTIREGQSFHLP
ncbi:MAG: hypothetical protein AB7T63_08490 [Planctomycetota bacterium]